MYFSQKNKKLNKQFPPRLETGIDQKTRTEDRRQEWRYEADRNLKRKSQDRTEEIRTPRNTEDQELGKENYSAATEIENKEGSSEGPGENMMQHILLRDGSWPLAAPGRRQWSSQYECALPIAVSSFVWPPRNWKSLSPDNKLWAWETAVALHGMVDGNFPTAPRTEKLDRYNFLALPGTAERRPMKNTTVEALARTRMWNHQFIRCCMSGKEVVDPDTLERCMVPLLQASKEDRWRGVVDMEDVVRDVPLQLELRKIPSLITEDIVEQ